MELAYPAVLLLFPLGVALLLLIRRQPRPIAVPSLAGVKGLRPGWKVRMRRMLPVLRVLAIGLIALGLARPREGEATTIIPSEGLDIAVSMDISGSMTQSSFGPDRVDRLEGAKLVLRDFIAERPDDRIGMVVFQKDAIPLAPPTLDHEALDAIVADIDTGLVEDGTAIGLGIGVAVGMLEQSEAASRVVILLTDGQHNQDSLGPLEAARLAEAAGVRVYTIGITAPGTSSSVAINSVDGELLTRVAELTGGQYFEASSVDDLAGVYEEIGTLETSGLARERFIAYREFGPWLLAAAALLLALEITLRSTVLGRASA